MTEHKVRRPAVSKTVLGKPVVDMGRIIIGCPWQLFSDDYTINMKSDKRSKYFGKLQFAEPFYAAFRNGLAAMPKWNSSLLVASGASKKSVFNYSAVHFRIEDDFIHHFLYQYNKVQSCYYLFKYVEFISKVLVDKYEPIIVQTGLKPSDSLYFGLKYLKHFFPNTIILDKRALLNELPEPFLRAPPLKSDGMSQLGAIFDMISVEKSRAFFGIRDSTFSKWCADTRQYGRQAKNAAPSFLLDLTSIMQNNTDIKLFETSADYRFIESLASSVIS